MMASQKAPTYGVAVLDHDLDILMYAFARVQPGCLVGRIFCLAIKDVWEEV